MRISKRAYAGFAGLAVLVVVGAIVAGGALTGKGTAAAGGEKSGRALEKLTYPFENIGIGGGGGMFTPAVSPVDARLMFMSCDMGGLYRSIDGGLSWQFVHFRQMESATSTKVLFDPADVAVMYDYGGPYAAEKLMVSRDTGKTWKPLIENAPWARSTDGGATWRECRGVSGRVRAFHVAATGAKGAGERVVFAASETGLWRSDDGGERWVSKTSGLVGDKLTGFCGGDDTRAGKTVLFATMASKAQGGKFTGGIFRSDDLGESWKSCMGEASGLNVRLGKVDEWGQGEIAQYYDIAMPRGQTEVVYVAAEGTGYHPPYHNTIYRSADSGKTWKYVFSSDVRYPDVNVEPSWIKFELQWGNDPATGIDVSDRDPDVVLRTENGCTYVTTDGGKSWKSCYTKLAPGQAKAAKGSAWQSTGMEVTTNWNYFFDPTDHNRQYICYTDIGFARSLDGGNSWIYSAEGSPWGNTWYDMVFDPEKPGVIYAACSGVHDIPHATYTGDRGGLGKGGVSVSNDFGKTWAPMKGLAESPITSICMDPKSPAEARTFWVTSYGLGVFKSADGGKTWAAKNKGLGHAKDMRAILIRRAESGNLYCAIGPMREGSNFPVPGGLWKSTDGGDSWRPLNAELAIGWQTGFAVDPKNENVIYSLAASGWSNRQGGVYKTTDGGKTWNAVWRNGSPGFEPAEVQPMFIIVHPDDSRILYLGTDGHGLWVSKDAGATWRLVEGLPFASVHRVTFDPADHSKIVVTTFGGGVWRGPGS